jgi:putative ABC transport system ATP-binding protein
VAADRRHRVDVLSPNVASTIALRGVGRVFDIGGSTVEALLPTTLSVSNGEWVALSGPSGSGKTTLLNLVAGLDRPSVGTLRVGGFDLATLDDAALTAWRAANVGLVFQDAQLLPGLTALENVIVARLPFERGPALVARALELLGAVGLAHRAGFPPARLSGGERQRVGIARALMGNPSILLADEPTGNLDGSATAAFLELVARFRSERSLTVLIATHDPIVAAAADRSETLGLPLAAL